MMGRKRKMTDRRPKQDAPEAEPAPTPPDQASTGSGDGGYEEVDLGPLGLPDEAERVIAELAAERDQAVAARQRALADFRNFQRRSLENEIRAVDRGKTDVVRSLLSVIDQFDMALEQRPDQVTVEQLLMGVEMIRDELMRALGDHAVRMIRPQRGDEFDPNSHEALLREVVEDVAGDHIVQVMQSGYALGDVVLRPAKVTLAEPNPEVTNEPSHEEDDDSDHADVSLGFGEAEEL
jgi:molecular chaperone GrpE